YADLQVGLNGCIYLGRDKHHYSVLYIHIGEKSHVIYTRSLVKIYVKGECVAMHPRDSKRGGYTLEKSHLASNTQAYRDRSPQHTLTWRMLSFRNLASSSNVCSQQPKSQLKHFIEVVRDCLNYSVPQIQSYLKQHVKLPFYIKDTVTTLSIA